MVIPSSVPRGSPVCSASGAQGGRSHQWPWACSQAGPVGFLWVVSGGSIPPAQVGCLTGTLPPNPRGWSSRSGQDVGTHSWGQGGATCGQESAEPWRVSLSGTTPDLPPASALPGPSHAVAGEPHLVIHDGHWSWPQALGGDAPDSSLMRCSPTPCLALSRRLSKAATSCGSLVRGLRKADLGDMVDAETRWWPCASLVLGLRHSQP